jgi:hypothetical protein
LTQSAAADKAEYNWGDSPTVVVTTTNQATVASPVVANISVRGPNGQTVLTDTQSFNVVPGTPHVFNIALPSSQGGCTTCRCRIQCMAASLHR